jgi:hypothetical protein
MSIRFSDASPDYIERFYEFIRRATHFGAPADHPGVRPGTPDLPVRQSSSPPVRADSQNAALPQVAGRIS